MSVTNYDLLINKIDYGDRVKTISGFIITIEEGAELTEDDGKVFVHMEKQKSYGKLEIYEEVIALYKKTCKLKRKK